MGKTRFRLKHFCFRTYVVHLNETRNSKVVAIKTECWKKEIEEVEKLYMKKKKNMYLRP